MSRLFGSGQDPYCPSKLKLSDRKVSAVTTDQPTDRDQGVDVSKYRRVILSVHPISPDINDATAAGWVLQVKIWRWKLNAKWGTGRSTGQWYAEEVVNISMDGDVATGGPMEYQFPTWASEKMLFQPVGSIDTPAGSWEAAISVYGLTPRIGEDGTPCDCAADSESSTVDIPINFHDYPVIIKGVPILGEARSIQATAVSANADASRPMMNLYGEWVLANYIWANQSNRTEEADPLDTRDVGDILADGTSVAEGATVDFYLDMAHFSALSIQWEPNDVNFTLKVYASNEDNGTAPNAANYVDVTNQWFGAASFTADAWLEQAGIQCKWVHIEVVRAGGGVGADTHELFTRRCYGA